MATARITAYTYVHDGAASNGLPHPAYNATATLGVIESGTPGTTTYVRPVTPKAFYLPGGSDQLAQWQADLYSYTPAGIYTCTYSPTTRRVTLATTNGVSFRPVMVEDLAIWLGFTQALAGYATSWTGEAAPAAVAELLAVTVEPAEDNARIDLHEYRHGRANAVVWGNHQLHRVSLFFDSATESKIRSGYLTTGRVSIQQGSDTAAYSATNPDGVVDGFVVAATDPTESDDVGGVWSIGMIVAVPR